MPDKLRGFDFQKLAALLIAIIGLCATARGQGLPAFNVVGTGSPDPVAVNGTVTFNVTITNLTPQFPIPNVFVTNSFSSTVTFVSATLDSASVNAGGSFTQTGSNVVFTIPALILGSQMTLSVQPSVAGTLTDTIDVASQGFSSLTTFASVQVTNSVPTSTDLSVSISPPPFGALVHDYVTYGVTVKNLGSAVTNVVLSNSIPAGVKLISVSPENSSATLININSLTNGAARTFQFTIEPTNSGVLTLSASASVAGFSETNTADNVVTTNLTIGDLVFGQLTATSLSAMSLNRQTGLMEQMIHVSNVSTSEVSSARVIVTGLAKSNLLFNAVGTNTLGSNAPSPFVVYTGKLKAGASVDLLMEYFSPTRAPFDLPDSDFVAVGGPAVNLSTTNVPSPNILRSVFLGDKGFLIEFDAILNRSYTILYSDNVNFSNALIAQPPIIAHANHVQWIDDGPPKTISQPTNSMRFYRVMLNP